MATVAEQRHMMENEILKDFYDARKAGEEPEIEDLPANLQRVVINNDRASAEAKAGKTGGNGLNQVLHDFYAARKAGLDPDIEDLPAKLQAVVRGNDAASAKAKADRAAKADPTSLNQLLSKFYHDRKAGLDPDVTKLPACLQRAVANNDAAVAKAKADRAAKAGAKANPAELNAQLSEFYRARRANENPDVTALPECLQRVVANNDRRSAEAKAEREAAAVYQ